MLVYRSANSGYDCEEVALEPGVLDPSWFYGHVVLGPDDYLDDPTSTKRVLQGPGRVDVAVAPDGGVRAVALDDTVTRPYAQVSALAGGRR